MRLVLICFLFFSLVAGAQNYYVANAGHSQANGQYSYAGEINGYPNWTNGIYSLHFTMDIGCTPKWVIMHADTMIYKNYDWTSYPPINNWQTTCYPGSISPAPIVISEQPYIEWSYGNYRELNDNTGQVSGQPPVSATLYSYQGHSFTGNTGDDLAALGKATCINVPAGLQMHVTKTSDTTLLISYSGHALQHRQGNSVYNCTVFLHSNATTQNDSLQVINNSYPYISLSFLQPQMYGYQLYFNELPEDIGTVENNPNRRIIINRFGGESFTGTAGENLFLTGKIFFDNLPAGLIPEVIFETDTLLRVAMQGAAVHHDNSNDIFPVRMYFRSTAFSGNDSTEILGLPVNLGFDFFGTIGYSYAEADGQYLFYPNPAHDFIIMENGDESGRIMISDLSGKTMINRWQDSDRVDIGILPEGVYILSYITGGKVYNSKLIKR
jgi:hypothetical protein